MKNWLTLRPLSFIIFSVKTLSEDPYLKSFISRVRTKHRERFHSFSRYAIRLRVEPYFLAALHRAVSTKAVNHCVLVKYEWMNEENRSSNKNNIDDDMR